MKANVSNPSGFPEFSPAQEQVRQHWLSVIRESFASYGFQPIETPLVEREENLVAKGGDPKEVYALKRILDEDGDNSHSGNALRFDHTVPLALYVARHLNDLQFPFKRYAIGPVFRGERAQKYRYRQFDQCDIDIIGRESLSPINDALCIAVMIEIFEKLNIGDFVVRINNRKILKGLFESVGVKESQTKDVLDAIDDLEKIGKEKVTRELGNKGFNNEQVEGVFAVIEKGVIPSVVEGSPSTMNEGIEELNQVLDALESMGVNKERYEFDLKIARGLDYYTGTVFETMLLGGEGREGISLCSGGRYDDLGAVFTGKSLPGVGASIGLTRLLHMLFDKGVLKPDTASNVDVLVLPFSPEQVGEALKVASTLRESGVKVDTYLEDKKIQKKFDYANKLGIPYCIVIGENEVSKKVVQLKNMESGEQEEVKVSDLNKNLFL